MAKVVLVSPPMWDPTHPYLASPILSAWLKTHGHSCRILDLNLDFIHLFLGPEFIASMVERVKTAMATISKLPSLTEEQAEWYRALLVGTAIPAVEAIAAARNSIDVLQSEERFFDPKELRRAYDGIDLVGALFRAAYWPARFGLPEWGFEFGNSSFSSARAQELAADRDRNPFLPFLASFVRDRFPRDAEIVGITISHTQLVAALTLARELRRASHPARIVLGGGLVAKILPGILRSEAFFANVDAVVSGEGELPLLELARRHEAGLGWEGIEGVATGPGGDSAAVGSQPLPAARVCVPDFDDLPLDRYLAPVRILPLASARGCYWDRCTFCARRRLYSGGYRARTSEAIVAEMESLARRHGARHFVFCDESLSPRTLKECSTLLAGRGYRWGAWLRFEPGFKREVWTAAAASGFSYALLGMESFSAEILQAMRKGSSPELIERQLDDMKANDVHAALFVIFGFPGETEETARETLDFVAQPREQLSLFGISAFHVDVLSEVWLDRESFGLAPVKPSSPDEDLRVYLSPDCYAVAATINWERIDSLRQELIGKIRQDLRSRQAMFLYASVGRAELLTQEDARPLARLADSLSEGPEMTGEALSLCEDVRTAATDFNLFGPSPAWRLSSPASVLVKRIEGEVFPLSGRLAAVVAMLARGTIGTEDLRRIWPDLSEEGDMEPLPVEEYVRLGGALGLFSRHESGR